MSGNLLHRVQFGKDRYHEIQDMAQWCQENIGAGRYPPWAVETRFGNTFFFFVNERDATLFSLRWA